MNFSRKILAVFLCVCLFMGATTFMVYAASQPELATAQNQEESDDQPTETSTPKVTSTQKPPSSKPETSTVTSTPKETSTPPKKSSNCYLSKLEVVRGTLTPAFSPEVTRYDVVITDGEGVPGVKPTVEHSGARFQKNVPVLPMGGTVTATVVVTAEDGTKMTYTLNMTRVPGTSSTESVDLNLSSGLTVSGDYPSANSLDVSALLGSAGALVSEVSGESSEEEENSGGGSNWLLFVGIFLIAAALGGIGFALYRQFFARPRDDYGRYDGDDYYDDGYGDYGDGYGDGYDGPYDDGGYGGYADDGYSDAPYQDDGFQEDFPEDVTPVDDDGLPYGAQNDLYDDTTAYIPPSNRGYDSQPRSQGYTRGGGQQPSRRPGATGPDPYRRGAPQRRAPGEPGRVNPNVRRSPDGRNPSRRGNPNDYRR